MEGFSIPGCGFPCFQISPHGFCDLTRLPFCDLKRLRDLHRTRSYCLLLHYFWFFQCQLMESYREMHWSVDVLPCTRIMVIFVDYRKRSMGLSLWDENSITGPWKNVLPLFAIFLISFSLCCFYQEHVKVSPPRVVTNSIRFFLLIQRYKSLLHIL